MGPLLLAAAGVVALVGGGLILRTFGPSYRVARLLATTPKVSVAEANRLAAERRPPYVRVDGRIDSDAEFEGPDHQPLVLRRVRLETRVGRAWRPFEDHRQTVPFTINEGLDSIAVDVERLDRGLVVVPRESIGTAADLADRVPAGTPPETTVRARIEQISSVEHAIVLGCPTLDGGDAHLTAGRGRPLVLTVLEPDEAMRVLAAEGRGRTRVAAALLGAAMILLLGAGAWAALAALLPAVAEFVPGARGLVAEALAASPEPSVAEGGDPRSNGQGPGLVGTPGLAILGVAAIAILAVLVTTVYVRLTASRHGADTAAKPGAGRRPPQSRR